MVSDAFAQRVTGDTGRITWKPDLVQGRLASLQLTGPEGSLDLYVVYLQAGTEADDRQARLTVLDQLRAKMRPRHQTWTLVVPWNYRGGDDSVIYEGIVLFVPPR